MFRDSQVIRSNFSRRDLLHPQWYPDDFTKWAVPYDALPTAQLHQGYYFPPYCSGGGYLLGPRAAGSIVAAYDARRAAQQPVVQARRRDRGSVRRTQPRLCHCLR